MEITMPIDLVKEPNNTFIRDLFNQLKIEKKEYLYMGNYYSTTKDRSIVFFNGEPLMVPITDLCFYTEEWQKGEKEVDELTQNGDVDYFNTIDDFFESME